MVIRSLARASMQYDLLYLNAIIMHCTLLKINFFLNSRLTMSQYPIRDSSHLRRFRAATNWLVLRKYKSALQTASKFIYYFARGNNGWLCLPSSDSPCLLLLGYFLVFDIARRRCFAIMCDLWAENEQLPYSLVWLEFGFLRYWSIRKWLGNRLRFQL